MNRKGLDEMQLAKRNLVGHQSFMLLFYLLLLNIGLHGSGIRWLAYPVDVFMIMLMCMSYYLIRVLAAGAYPSTAAGKGSFRRLAVLSLLSAAAAGVVAFWAKGRGLAEDQAGRWESSGALLLFAIAIIVMIVCVAVQVWSHRRNNRGED